MKRDSSAPFFIGWAAPPKELRAFLISLAVSLVVFAGLIAYLTAATQNDPGNGAFMGRANATGILQLDPYPVVHVIDSDRFVAGAPLILSGNGKIGVRDRAAEFDGQLVKVAGARLARGDLNGLQLRGGANGLAAAEGDLPVLETRDLGRWRLTGEICDGKCLIGAMRPGRGLAHKACATLCLDGGVPPVFVATDKVEGSEFFLLAGPAGGPIGDEMLDLAAVFIQAEGQIERRGMLNVFLLDPATIEVVR